MLASYDHDEHPDQRAVVAMAMAALSARVSLRFVYGLPHSGSGRMTYSGTTKAPGSSTSGLMLAV